MKKRLELHDNASSLRDKIIGLGERSIQKSYYPELQKKLEQLNNIVANSPGVIFRSANDPEWTISFISAAVTKITGYAADEFVGNKVRSFASIIHPDDRDIIYAAVQLSLKKREPYEFDYRIIAADGAVLWVHEIGRGVFGHDGELLGLDGVIVDITERKLIEDNINKMLDELRRSNRELEELAYVASHDLKEPLRMIASYVKLLHRDYNDKLDETARKYMTYIFDGTKRAYDLIEDLLSFSRVEKSQQAFTRFNSSIPLQKAIDNLTEAINESRAKIHIGHLPDINGDSGQLAQVFQNLLSNSIKFRRANDPEIYIDAEKIDNEWVFFVRDNGIGIDPKFFNKIFTLFQRLHTRREYPGTGIGLAIVKKIIENHNGRIWVESSVNKGATFFFTIPKDINETAG